MPANPDPALSADADNLDPYAYDCPTCGTVLLAAGAPCNNPLCEDARPFPAAALFAAEHRADKLQECIGVLESRIEALMRQQPAAALSAFRAACVALVDRDDPNGMCPLCGAHATGWCSTDSPGRMCPAVHAPTCPVALARVALEKFPAKEGE